MNIAPSLVTPSTPLISAADLLARCHAGAPLCLLDVRFDLAKPEAGAQAYAAGHLPGAHYLHLEHDLSMADPAQAFCGGRHPLPQRAQVAALAARLGLTPDVPVVVYDAQGGMFAARAWWMLRWIGHPQVSVLDGGVPAWLAAGGTLDTAAVPAPTPAATWALPADGQEGDAQDAASRVVWTADQVAAALAQSHITLVDARAPERYRGDVEPLDPVAGHIPGALNRPFSANLGPNGCFQAPEVLREAFAPLLAVAAQQGPLVHQCGSGVTACHNLLAMAVAGLPTGALYAGSWSEWCRDPARPVARG